jgi:hypothetical protein
MPARPGRRDHLRAMEGIRRREHDGIDVRIGQRLFVGPVERQVLRGRELFVVVRLAARRSRHDSGLYFAIRRSDHFGSAATLSLSGRPSSFFTTFTPCTSATIL